MSTLRPVPGFPGDFVRVLTALEMVQLVEGGEGTEGMRGAMRFATLCTVDEAGNRRWPDEAAAGAAEWTRIKACALEGFRANGLTPEDGDEAPAAGN